MVLVFRTVDHVSKFVHFLSDGHHPGDLGCLAGGGGWWAATGGERTHSVNITLLFIFIPVILACKYAKLSCT